MLRPIAYKFPDEFVEGALNVWLKKSLLGNVIINKAYEKIIQIVIAVYTAQVNQKTGKLDFVLPVHVVVTSMIKYIETRPNPLVNKNKWKKNNPSLSVTETASESLLNSFLYAYLVYNPCMYDHLFFIR